MASKTLFLAVSALAGAALVASQAAPNWQYVRRGGTRDAGQD